MVLIVYALDAIAMGLSLSDGHSHPKREAYDQYRHDLSKHDRDVDRYERSLRAFWIEMSPRRFEREMASLFESEGYETEVTRYVADGGVDIRLRMGERRVLVQCKRFQGAAGPAPVRELYGVMMHEGISEGILVCTGGFTKGAIEFAKGKPIRLLSLRDILQLQAKKEK